MKFLNDYVLKNKLLAKLIILKQLLFSEKYIVIAIKNNKKKNIVNVDFQFSVTKEEMNYYTKYLNEYVINTDGLLDSANDIIKKREM